MGKRSKKEILFMFIYIVQLNFVSVNFGLYLFLSFFVFLSRNFLVIMLA